MSHGSEKFNKSMIVSAIAIGFCGSHAWAAGADGKGDGGIEEIVVTAQKREQSLNDVGMSVSALTGEQLANQGVADAADLVKVIPGFSFTPTQFGAPVYTIRGVGFNESSLSGSPTVSVYVDEVSLPFPVMARGAILDLERVEVLKGPQGTLFGQNSTGGAINYIAAKPTREFEAGIGLSYGSYDAKSVDGFVSAPISNDWAFRAAFKSDQGGAWQRNSANGESLGSKDFVAGRALFEYSPSASFKVGFNLNTWRDRSDIQAPQFIGAFAAMPVPALDSRVSNAVVANSDARMATWGPGNGFKRDNTFDQASVRLDAKNFSPGLTFTSITVSQKFQRNELMDTDGTTAANLHIGTGGDINSFSQEFRLSGDNVDKLHWMVGGNYGRDAIVDTQRIILKDSSVGAVLGFGEADNYSKQDIKTTAVFVNGDYSLSDNVSIEGGMRHTQSDRDFEGCTKDSGAGDLGAVMSYLQGLVNPAATSRPVPGGCATFNSTYNVGMFNSSLSEKNTSWRTGLNWKPSPQTLLYGNISKGFKSGNFPTLSASTTAQFAPAVQEELLAKEIGFKLSLDDRKVQLNGALFNYDYVNKQLRGRIQDPIFGQLETLVNIPKSEVNGLELQLTWAPIRGLVINGSATAILTEVKNFIGFDQFGAQKDMTGNAFPYSPKYQVSLGADHLWRHSESINAFIGANVTYRSETKGGIENDPRLAIDAYSTVDLRGGVEASSGAWKLSLWGKNVGNTYYWNNVLHAEDTIIRYAGTPASYGVTFQYKF